jgi:hypothetical protein
MDPGGTGGYCLWQLPHQEHWLWGQVWDHGVDRVRDFHPRAGLVHCQAHHVVLRVACSSRVVVVGGVVVVVVVVVVCVLSGAFRLESFGNSTARTRTLHNVNTLKHSAQNLAHPGRLACVS